VKTEPAYWTPDGLEKELTEHERRVLERRGVKAVSDLEAIEAIPSGLSIRQALIDEYTHLFDVYSRECMHCKEKSCRSKLKEGYRPKLLYRGLEVYFKTDKKELPLFTLNRIRGCAIVDKHKDYYREGFDSMMKSIKYLRDGKCKKHSKEYKAGNREYYRRERMKERTKLAF